MVLGKNRHKLQWDKTEGPKMSESSHNHLIFDKDAKNTSQRIQYLPQTMLGKLDAHIQKNEIRPITIILHKKSIRNGSKSSVKSEMPKLLILCGAFNAPPNSVQDTPAFSSIKGSRS